MNSVKKFIKSFYYIPFFKASVFSYGRLFWKIPTNIDRILSDRLQHYYPGSDILFFDSWTDAMKYCLSFIFEKYNKKKVLVPDMMCEKVNKMIEIDLRWEVVSYKINKDLSINMEHLKNLLTKETDVASIVVPHYWWIFQTAIYDIKKYIKDNGLNVSILDDAAQWFPVENAWYIWDFGILSFGRGKFISAIKWWALIINNESYKSDIWWNVQYDKKDHTLFDKAFYLLYYVYSSYFQGLIYALQTMLPGIKKINNGKKTKNMKRRDMLLVSNQMMSVDDMISAKRKQFVIIKNSVSKYEAEWLMQLINDEKSVYTKLIILFKDGNLRQRFQDHLLNKRIATDIWFDEKYAAIPTWVYMDDKKLHYMINAIHDFFKSLM